MPKSLKNRVLPYTTSTAHFLKFCDIVSKSEYLLEAQKHYAEHVKALSYKWEINGMKTQKCILMIWLL